jgi:hypothetical protein
MNVDGVALVALAEHFAADGVSVRPLADGTIELSGDPRPDDLDALTVWADVIREAVRRTEPPCGLYACSTCGAVMLLPTDRKGRPCALTPACTGRVRQPVTFYSASSKGPTA